MFLLWKYGLHIAGKESWVEDKRHPPKAYIVKITNNWQYAIIMLSLNIF